MEKELWLGRELKSPGWYGIYRGEPDKEGLKDICVGMSEDTFRLGGIGLIKGFCPRMFHAVVPKTARLRKGRKRKIKRILIELED